MWETRVWSLGWDEPLEKEMANHSSFLAWRIPWIEEPVGLRSMGCKESDTTEWLTHFPLASFSFLLPAFQPGPWEWIGAHTWMCLKSLVYSFSEDIWTWLSCSRTWPPAVGSWTHRQWSCVFHMTKDLLLFFPDCLHLLLCVPLVGHYGHQIISRASDRLGIQPNGPELMQRHCQDGLSSYYGVRPWFWSCLNVSNLMNSWNPFQGCWWSVANHNSTWAVPTASFVHLWRSLRFWGFPEAKTTVMIMPGYYGTFFIGWTFALMVQNKSGKSSGNQESGI